MNYNVIIPLFMASFAINPCVAMKTQKVMDVDLVSFIQSAQDLNSQGHSDDQLENTCDEQVIEPSNTWKWLAGGIAITIFSIGGWYWWCNQPGEPQQSSYVRIFGNDNQQRPFDGSQGRQAEPVVHNGHDEARPAARVFPQFYGGDDVVWVPEQQHRAQQEEFAARQQAALDRLAQERLVNNAHAEELARQRAQDRAAANEVIRQAEIRAAQLAVQHQRQRDVAFAELARRQDNVRRLGQELDQAAQQANQRQAFVQQLENDMIRDVGAAPIEDADRIIAEYEVRFAALQRNQ